MWRGEMPINQEVKDMDTRQSRAQQKPVVDQLEKVQGKEYVANLRKLGLLY